MWRMCVHTNISKNMLVYALSKSPDTNINIFNVGVRNVGVSVVIGWCGMLVS